MPASDIIEIIYLNATQFDEMRPSSPEMVGAQQHVQRELIRNVHGAIAGHGSNRVATRTNRTL